MICTEIYNGQGLGNQLWTYAVTMAIARREGLQFGIASPHKFKGHQIFELLYDIEATGGEGPEGGPPTRLPDGIDNYLKERLVDHPVWKCAIGKADPRFMSNVPDRTKIEGYMQCEDYILGFKQEISSIMKPRDEFILDDLYDQNVCVINFRGTPEYLNQPHVFLGSSYWGAAIAHVHQKDPETKFIVVTDDIRTAQAMFPGLQCFHGSIAQDYGILYSAKKLIVSNSSFAWFPAWTSPFNELTVAPKYWARHNVSDGFWSMGDSLTRGWTYIDRSGNASDYESCKIEKDEYERINSHLWKDQ